MSILTTKAMDQIIKDWMNGPYGRSLREQYGHEQPIDSVDHSKALAMQAWFCSRGATGAGQWPGDQDDFEKQTKAREEFDAWWRGDWK